MSLVIDSGDIVIPAGETALVFTCTVGKISSFRIRVEVGDILLLAPNSGKGMTLYERESFGLMSDDFVLAQRGEIFELRARNLSATETARVSWYSLGV